MWALFESIHAVTYFAPPARAAFEEVGLRGFWRGYFAGRAAPLGPIGLAPVVAAFFGFAPGFVARAIPDVWQRAAPEAALAARLRGAVDSLTLAASTVDGAPAAANGAALDESALEEAADLLQTATAGLDHAGRVLAAANAALPQPAGAMSRIWQSATLLREHRGDGHVAALVAAGVTGCEALAWRTAIDLPRDLLQPARGWSDDDWRVATDRLVTRGWVTPDGRATAEGVAAYQTVEEVTDRCAAAPWDALGPTGTDRVARLLTPLARACRSGMPTPNPIGLAAID
jgi:hypothetical protein